MTDAQEAGNPGRVGFLVAGFRELGRKLSRVTLRRKMRGQAVERTVALAALGQRAWEEQVDLTAFGDLRDRLTGLQTRAGELSQTTSKLDAQRASREQERRAELEKFAARRRAVEEKKNPVDAALRAARSRKAEYEQVAGQADSRLRVLAGKITTLGGEIASVGGLAGPDQPQRLAAAEAERSRLQSEQQDLATKLAAARAALPGLAGEEHRLATESQQHAAEIAAIDVEQKTTLARIDADLMRVRSESQGASQQTNAVQKERAQSFGSLGQGLYDSGTQTPALAEHVARVAAIDRARAETESVLGSSLTDTRSLAGGTMLKFWSVLIGVPLVLAAAGVGTHYYVTRRAAPVVATAPSASTDPETERNLIIQRFVQSGGRSDRNVRESAVRILKEDILTMGATANPAHLATLTRILRSDEAELRTAAADAIGMIGPTSTETPDLARLLNDPVGEVAGAARRALAESSDSEARDLARNVQAGKKQGPGAP